MFNQEAKKKLKRECRGDKRGTMDHNPVGVAVDEFEGEVKGVSKVFTVESNNGPFNSGEEHSDLADDSGCLGSCCSRSCHWSCSLQSKTSTDTKASPETKAQTMDISIGQPRRRPTV